MLRLPNYRDVSQASKQVATDSAMNPILWKVAISFPVSVITAALAPPPISYFILAVGSLPIVIGSIVFAYFAKTSPDRLQSETHVENMEIISRMQDPETGEIVTIEAEANVPNLPAPGGKNE